MEGSDRKARILIVEDESIVALDMRNQLIELGYEIVGVAASGEDAVASASAKNPDLILMDIRLKGAMDGVEAAERIRSELDVPIIFITAYADEKTLARAKVTQAFGYILKPFHGREVLISIEMALYKHKIDYELRSSREWLNGTLNAISDAVVALDDDERIKFVNRAAEALFGLDTAAARGRLLGDFCSFSENAALSGLFEEQRRGLQETDISWLLLDLPSRKLPVELIRTIIPDPRGNAATGKVLVIRDITELVGAVETRSRLAAIVANSYDAILSVGADHRILSWNFGAELMYGYPGPEVIGRPLPDLVPEERDKAQLRVITDQVFAGREAGRFDSFRRCRSGKVIPVAMSLSPVRDAQGRVVELACIERDVSAEKEYEASLVKAKLAAEEASRAKGEFLSNMSHELRTPLNSIIGMIELARDDLTEAERAEYLEIARQSADSLLFLINSILDFSKIEIGKMRINAAPFCLAEAVADSLESIAVQSYQKGLHLVFRFDPGFPDSVIGDAHRLQQILANLLSNAIKFTEIGGVRVDLNFTRNPDGASVMAVLAVRDSGIGIPQDRFDYIWEEFTQLDGSSTRSYGGTGLGLAIVKSLVNLMGGTVRVESEPKKGSLFTVELPFALAAGSKPTVSRVAQFAEAEVAIASSDEEARTILAELLTAWGFAASEFGTASDLLDRLRRADLQPPRLVLADENLNGRSALFSCSEDEECIRLLRNRLVVMADGGGRKDAGWRSLSSTARFLIKPVRFRSLREILVSGETASRNPVLQHPAGASAGGTETKARVIREAEDDADATARRISEIMADPKVLGEVERFIEEAGALGASPSRRLETSAARYRKTLEGLRTVELPRSLLKITLACRRNDAGEVKTSLEAIRGALRACEAVGEDGI